MCDCLQVLHDFVLRYLDLRIKSNTTLFCARSFNCLQPKQQEPCVSMNAICILVVSSPRLVNLYTGTVSKSKKIALRAMPSRFLGLLSISKFSRFARCLPASWVCSKFSRFARCRLPSWVCSNSQNRSGGYDEWQWMRNQMRMPLGKSPSLWRIWCEQREPSP